MPPTDDELLDFEYKPPTDDELLAFDYQPIAEPRSARELLEQHGDRFRFQLVIALHLDGWARRADERRDANPKPEFNDGFVRALEEVAAHIRQGNYLPGGSLPDGSDSTESDSPPQPQSQGW